MPDRTTDQQTEPRFLSGGGEMGALMRAHDWSTSPLGPPNAWPQSLRTVVGLMLNSRYPMFVAWGPKLAFLYNDGYRPIFGAKHPHALGLPFRTVWSEIWDDIWPLIQRALAGEATWSENLHLVMERNGYPEDTWYTFSYSPVRDETGHVAGMFCACTETTDKVLADRRQAFRLELESRLRDLSDPLDIIAAAEEALGLHLGASRVGYGVVDETARFFTTERNWTDGTVAQSIGTHDLLGFGSEILGAMRQGKTLVAHNVFEDPRTNAPDRLAAFAVIETAAVVTVSLVKNGRLTAALYVHDRAPRQWSDDDVKLIEDVAERTWATVERARAEAALRESEERLRLALAASQTVGTWIWDVPGDRVVADERFARLFSVDPSAAAAGAPIEAFVGAMHPDDRPRVEAAIARAVETGGEYEAEYRLIQPDGSVRWVYTRGRCEHDADGRPTRFPGALVDITERKRTEDALRDAMARLDAALMGVGVGTWTWQLPGKRIVGDRNVAALFGITEEEARASTPETYLSRIHPDDRPQAEAALARAMSGGPYLSEHRVLLPDGRVRWISASGRVQTDEAGQPRMLVGVLFDISEHKRAEERKNLLLDELSHRVKNTLASVQSIADQTLRSAESPDAFRRAFSERLIALAQAHNLLSRSNWEGAALRDVIEAELSPYLGGDRSRVVMAGEAVVLPPRVALPLGMALHELATNAAKYGALSRPAGKVDIAWDLPEDDGGRCLALRWIESGGPPVEPPARRGFGSTLIARGLAHELDGDVDLAFERSGVRCTMRLPLRAEEAGTLDVRRPFA